ncbi:hypothetical protein ACQCV9_29145, partial [Bacillus mobilis]
IQPFLGLGLIVAIILAALYYYFYELNVQKELKQNYLLLFSLIFILSLLLMKCVSLLQLLQYPEIGFIFPAAMAAMLIRILINERLAILITIVLAICGSVM